MARGVNKVILIGNLGGDPEVRYTQNGNAVANLSLATTAVWRDKQSGELQERTEWHRIVFFNRLAEIVGEYLKKGSKIYVEGGLRTRKWTDKAGADRFTTEIIANEMHILDNRGSVSSVNANNANDTSVSAPVMEMNSNNSTSDTATSDVSDDDIPF